MSNFVHLHCHTEYSLLDGAIRINDLAARAKDFGMPAAAITDHGNLYGAAYFYMACKDVGSSPSSGARFTSTAIIPIPHPIWRGCAITSFSWLRT